uniref:G-protein coupled receptors family 1 profile domain-containing protein n=1 Tax=Setaria digitata TaxID=48799 RepID=A0A915PIA5_9BILA
MDAFCYLGPILCRRSGSKWSALQVSLSVRTIFIGSLAISDVVVSLTSLPVTAVTIFTRDWVFPPVFCKFIGVFQGGSIFVSSFTFTAVAVDRLLLILFPHRKILTFERTFFIVVSIWTIGYAMSLPVGIFSVTVTYFPYCGTFCEESWPDSTTDGESRMERIYGISVLTLQFGMPVIICSLCYWKISRVISRQIEKRKEQQFLLKESERRLQDRRTRSNRMMVCMVLSFVLAWLPLNLINLSRDFYGVSSLFSIMFALCHVIAMTSAVWNPVIYTWFNPQLRSTKTQHNIALQQRTYT